MAFEGEIPIALAALRNSVVLNGVGGFSLRLPSMILFTIPVFPSFA